MIGTIDIVVLLACMLLVQVASRWPSRTDATSFVLAGRSLSLPFLVASLVATWYGAVLGSGEFVMRYGIAFLLCFGLPYYIIAALYAVILTRRIRASQTISIPDHFGSVYGDGARRVAAIVMLAVTIPASYQLMIGVMVRDIVGLPTIVSIATGTVISLSLIYRGGLQSDVYANVVQFILMYAGMILLALYAMNTFGSPIPMWKALPQQTTSVPGPIGWQGIVGWLLIALQTFVDPNFFVRTVAARETSTARKSILISIACWMVFDALQLFCGLYIVAFRPDTPLASSYLGFALDILPMGVKGLFVASLASAVISTLNGYALSGATMLAHDVFPTIGAKYHPRRRYQLALICLATVGALISVAFPSIIDILFYSGSIVVSCTLLPLVLSGNRKMQSARGHIVPILIVPGVVVIISLITSTGEPIFAGLTTSALLILISAQFKPNAATTRNTLHNR